MEWITCENTYEESWRRLLEYANVELATDEIVRIHGESNNNLSNYKKQAAQVRVSLLQAKEYFDAVKNSSLYTQPNHLYYGTIALATACMLLRGDGSFSLDFLRKDKKNQHHGLDFTFSSSSSLAKSSLSLLENGHVKICPNGHFGNWFKSLNLKQVEFGLVRQLYKQNASEAYDVVGVYDLPKFNELSNVKRSIIELLKKLPDLNNDLSRYGIRPESARGDCLLINDVEKKIQSLNFTFHSCASRDILAKIIIDRFECEEGVIFCYDINPNETSAFVSTKPNVSFSYSFPESRTTLDHKNIYYLEKINLPEIVDLYLISYALSMLSRYYPDIWVSFIESHCKGAKLVERLMSVLVTKIPILMLNQFTDRQFVISSHRPFWH